MKIVHVILMGFEYLGMGSGLIKTYVFFMSFHMNGSISIHQQYFHPGSMVLIPTEVEVEITFDRIPRMTLW